MSRQSDILQLVQLAAHREEVFSVQLQHQIERTFIERRPLADFQLALDVPVRSRAQLGLKLAGDTGFMG